jgi:hypothetical protein
MIPEIQDLIRAIKGQDSRTSICVTQIFGWEDYCGDNSGCAKPGVKNETEPPAPVKRAMAFAALTLGCRGLLLYSYYDLYLTAGRARAPAAVVAQRLADLKALGQEIKTYEQAFLGDVADEKLQRVQQPEGVVSGLRCAGSQCTLFLVNLMESAQTVHVEAGEAGGFEGSLEGYGVHAQAFQLRSGARRVHGAKTDDGRLEARSAGGVLRPNRTFEVFDAEAPALPTLAEAFRLIEAQQQQLIELRGEMLLRPGLGHHPDARDRAAADEKDDTALLDSLALAGGAIELEPRIYRRRGTWKLGKNRTHVRGWAGITRLLVQEAAPGLAFSGIQITACPDADPNAKCAYGNQYSRDKPLSHVYVEGVSIEIIQNQALDPDGHCCGFLSDPHNQHGGNGGGQYALLVTNVAYGYAIDVAVSGAHFQGIGLVNTASFHLVRPVSTFCFSTDIAINDFSFDCTITDALVTTDGWPAGTNWTGELNQTVERWPTKSMLKRTRQLMLTHCPSRVGQFKDDALAVQGYTKGNRIEGGTVRLGKIQASHGR